MFTGTEKRIFHCRRCKRKDDKRKALWGEDLWDRKDGDGYQDEEEVVSSLTNSEYVSDEAFNSRGNSAERRSLWSPTFDDFGSGARKFWEAAKRNAGERSENRGNGVRDETGRKRNTSRGKNAVSQMEKAAGVDGNSQAARRKSKEKGRRFDECYSGSNGMLPKEFNLLSVAANNSRNDRREESDVHVLHPGRGGSKERVKKSSPPHGKSDLKLLSERHGSGERDRMYDSPLHEKTRSRYKEYGSHEQAGIRESELKNRRSDVQLQAGKRREDKRASSLFVAESRATSSGRVRLSRGSGLPDQESTAHLEADKRREVERSYGQLVAESRATSTGILRTSRGSGVRDNKSAPNTSRNKGGLEGREVEQITVTNTEYLQNTNSTENDGIAEYQEAERLSNYAELDNLRRNVTPAQLRKITMNCLQTRPRRARPREDCRTCEGHECRRKNTLEEADRQDRAEWQRKLLNQIDGIDGALSSQRRRLPWSVHDEKIMDSLKRIVTPRRVYNVEDEEEYEETKDYRRSNKREKARPQSLGTNPARRKIGGNDPVTAIVIPDPRKIWRRGERIKEIRVSSPDRMQRKTEMSNRGVINNQKSMKDELSRNHEKHTPGNGSMISRQDTTRRQQLFYPETPGNPKAQSTKRPDRTEPKDLSSTKDDEQARAILARKRNNTPGQRTARKGDVFNVRGGDELNGNNVEKLSGDLTPSAAPESRDWKQEGHRRWNKEVEESRTASRCKDMPEHASTPRIVRREVKPPTASRAMSPDQRYSAQATRKDSGPSPQCEKFKKREEASRKMLLDQESQALPNFGRASHHSRSQERLENVLPCKRFTKNEEKSSVILQRKREELETRESPRDRHVQSVMRRARNVRTPCTRHIEHDESSTVILREKHEQEQKLARQSQESCSPRDLHVLSVLRKARELRCPPCDKYNKREKQDRKTTEKPEPRTANEKYRHARSTSTRAVESPRSCAKFKRHHDHSRQIFERSESSRGSTPSSRGYWDWMKEEQVYESLRESQKRRDSVGPCKVWRTHEEKSQDLLEEARLILEDQLRHGEHNCSVPYERCQKCQEKNNEVDCLMRRGEHKVGQRSSSNARLKRTSKPV